MSAVDDIRKLFQDYLAPYQSGQSQYSALQTNMELIKQQMKNNHDALMNKLNAIAYVIEKEKV